VPPSTTNLISRNLKETPTTPINLLSFDFKWPWSEEETLIKEEVLVTLESRIIVSNMKAGVEPYFFDINSDGFIDILVSLNDSPTPLFMVLQKYDTVNKVKTWSNVVSFDSFLTTLGDKTTCITPDKARALTNPHFNFYTDLNGDCVPDLFLTTVHKNSSGFTINEMSIYLQIFDESINEFRFCMTYN